MRQEIPEEVTGDPVAGPIAREGSGQLAEMLAMLSETSTARWAIRNDGPDKVLVLNLSFRDGGDADGTELELPLRPVPDHWQVRHFLRTAVLELHRLRRAFYMRYADRYLLESAGTVN